jgi:redox-sensing transcriptional repressor
MMKSKVSNAVIKRLPRYRRYLNELKNKDVDRVSSGELSDLIGYTASQIRQDFNTFGGFGQQGYGYNVKDLYDEINNILGLDQNYLMVIVGIGNLGQAVANHTNISKGGFEIVGLFDLDENVIGKEVNQIKVRSINELLDFLKENSIDIGIITTNEGGAQSVADTFVEGGVRGIWNFAPVDLNLPADTALENVHLTDSLYSLAFHIKHQI